MRPNSLLFATLSCLAAGLAVGADVVTTGSDNLSVDASPHDGALAIDLLGTIWTIPPHGGEARAWTDGIAHASRPRWSPDGAAIAYQRRSPTGSQIWQVDIASTENSRLINSDGHAQDPAWHPVEPRVIFAADRKNQGLDIWEVDLRTGLQWRLTDLPGDESEPVWSANGRHLAFISRQEGHYAVVLRRHGEADVELYRSESPLRAPAWRPDGSLITFTEQIDGSWVLQTMILSSPPLLRNFVTIDGLHAAPVSWVDRMRLVYAANGRVMMRGFEDRRGRPVHFRAMLDRADIVPTSTFVALRRLEIVNPSAERLVIRAARLFDGIRSYYQPQIDVLIEDGIIQSMSPRQQWPNATVLDLGDVTLMPGLIDAWAGLPEDLKVEDGASLLAYGITTLASPDLPVDFDANAWQTAATPGPRVLRAANGGQQQPGPDFVVARVDAAAPQSEISERIAEWHASGVPVIADNGSNGVRIAADAFIGARAQMSANLTRNVTTLPPTSQSLFLSALAGRGFPDLRLLSESRQASRFSHAAAAPSASAGDIRLATSPALVIAASRSNGLPPGYALHAELAAMSVAGFTPAQALQSAGRNAARFLGIEDQVGILVSGGLADLLLVSGDPLADAGATLNIVAVIRNGRFFSQVSLLER